MQDRSTQNLIIGNPSLRQDIDNINRMINVWDILRFSLLEPMLEGGEFQSCCEESETFFLVHLRKIQKYMLPYYSDSTVNANSGANRQKNSKDFNENSEDEEQGFSKKEQFALEIITAMITRDANVSSTAHHKSKTILREPLCIYSGVPLYMYPQGMDTIPSTTEHQQKNKNKSQTAVLVRSPELYSNSEPTGKLSQFPTNPKFLCVYNRHSQNLSIKSDLTILIKNIKMAVQTDMLFPFTKPYPPPTLPTSLTSSMIPNLGQSQGSFANQRYTKMAEKDQARSRLRFQSNFQCGNLHSVFKEVGSQNYYLFLQNDVNTHGYNQWFCFWVAAVATDSGKDNQYTSANKNKANSTYKPNSSPPRLRRSPSIPPPNHPPPPPNHPIHNYPNQSHSPPSPNPNPNPRTHTAQFFLTNISKDIKFHPQMRIVTYKNGRYFYDTPFLYYRNKYERYNGMNFMTIQFGYTFQVEEDDGKGEKGEGQEKEKERERERGKFVQFSLTYPYSCTKLVRLLREVKVWESVKWNIDLETIGKSQGNNFIYMVKLTKKQLPQPQKHQPSSSLQPPKKKLPPHLHSHPLNKKCILILARQHPSQTISSHICHALLLQILSSPLPPSSEHYDWYLIPMVNPDGVVHGNSRTNLKGYDVNRCWAKERIFVCSEVEAVNGKIEEIKGRYGGIAFVVDLHGHSKDFGAFLYFSENCERNRVLNYLFSEKSEIFNYYKSKYGINYKKRPTLRGQMFYRSQLKNTITIETSFYGYKKPLSPSLSPSLSLSQPQPQQFIPFNASHYTQIAKTIYQVLLQYEQMQVQRSIEENRTLIARVNEKEKLRVQVMGKGSDDDGADSVDSDSDPEDQYLEKVERVSLGIQVMDKEEDIGDKREGVESRQQKKQANSRYTEKNGEIEEQEQDPIEQRTRIRKALLNRYNALNKKTKQMKKKRKPIYTNSNVQILTFQKLAQLDRTFKKYSVDQSNEILPKKTLSQLEQKRQKRAMSSTSDQRRIHGSEMRSQPLIQFPTSSNVKLDPAKLAKIQEQIAEERAKWMTLERKVEIQGRKDGTRKETRSVTLRQGSGSGSAQGLVRNDWRTQREKIRSTSRKNQRKEYLKLTWNMINREKQEKTRLLQHSQKPLSASPIKLAVVSRSYQSQPNL